MKIMHSYKGDTHESINFVDDNNVFVGFDFFNQCCENYGYFFSKNIPNDEIPENTENDAEFNLENYNFDTNFFRQDDLIATFRLFNKQNIGNVIYLSIYNEHNGYYMHGFVMEENNRTLHRGEL